jgi:hypothetical protein
LLFGCLLRDTGHDSNIWARLRFSTYGRARFLPIADSASAPPSFRDPPAMPTSVPQQALD